MHICGELRQQGINFLGGNVYLIVLCFEGGWGLDATRGEMQPLASPFIFWKGGGATEEENLKRVELTCLSI